MCHVLIIEDDFLISTFIQMVVEDNGATSIEVVTTESEAIQAALAKRPGVITSDITLKEGTGLKAVETIHARAGLIPVIFITATPELCAMTGSHVRVLGKPATEGTIKQAFSEVFPAC